MLNTHSTFAYRIDGGSAFFTCYGSDADTYGKGWRSIGCFSCDERDANANVLALVKSGWKAETRTARQMALIALRDLSEVAA